MSPNLRWSRRTFIAAAGMTGVGSVVTRLRAVEAQSASPAASSAGFVAYVGFVPAGDSAAERVETYRVDGGRWTAAAEPQPHQAPRALALHPSLAILYAAHSTAEHLFLPRGSVSAYRAGSAAVNLSPSLMSEARQPLSLSATYPEHLAVSPDGRALLVSAADGGAYNLFSLDAEGALQPTPYALKQVGSGPHPLQERSRPQAVVFHPSGTSAYASDLGSDRVNHLALAGGEMTVASRVSFAAGSGPAHLAVHPSGRLLVVSNQLRAGLSVVPLDEQGKLGTVVQEISLDAETSGPVAINRAGDRVYAVARRITGESVVSTYALSRATGRLRPMMGMPVSGFGDVEQIALADGQLLLAGTTGIASLLVDRRSGLLGEASVVVRQPGAVSIAVRMA